MPSMLTPAYTVRMGSQEWTEQLLEIRVQLAAGPSVDAAMVVLPATPAFTAQPGDAALVTLDSGERREVVFAGAIDRIRRTPATIVVSLINAGGLMARVHPAATFEQITAGKLVRELCTEAKVDPGDIDDGVSLPFYVADPARTGWQHVTRVAGWGGALVSVSTENKVDSVVVDAARASHALRFGRELLAYAFDANRSYIDTFATAGESGVGDASDEKVLRTTADFFGGNRPSGPGPGSSWLSAPALRTAEAAATASAARKRIYDATRDVGQFTAFLLPHLRPGTVIEVQDLPEIPVAPYWVQRVEHTLSAAGALTRVQCARGGDAFNPASLLGSLGSLL
ncbi:MAG: hypothetical protein QM736_22480 [Vicinamibacterales bacterium]